MGTVQWSKSEAPGRSSRMPLRIVVKTNSTKATRTPIDSSFGRCCGRNARTIGGGVGGLPRSDFRDCGVMIFLDFSISLLSPLSALFRQNTFGHEQPQDAILTWESSAILTGLRKKGLLTTKERWTVVMEVSGKVCVWTN